MYRLKSMVLVSLVVFTLFTPICSADSGEDSMMLQARSHYGNGSYYFATPWLERILKKYPKTAYRKEILLMMAKSYASSWREEKAVLALAALLKECPEAAAALDPQLQPLAAKAAATMAASAVTAGPAPAEGTAKPAYAPVAAAGVASLKTQGAPSSPATSVALAKPAAGKLPATNPTPTVVTAAAGKPKAPQLQAAVKPEAGTTKAAPSAPAAAPARLAARQPADAAAATAATAPPMMAKTEVSSQKQAEKKRGAKRDRRGFLATVETSAFADLRKIAAPDMSNPMVATVEFLGEKAFTLIFGEYVLRSAVTVAQKKIRELGMAPQVTPGPRRVEAMTRLLVGEFPDRESARKQLENIRALKGDGFILKSKAGRYYLYARSFINPKFAQQEQQRLEGLGVKTTLQKRSVAVPTYLVTAGKLSSREAALKEAARFKGAGMPTVMVEVPGLPGSRPDRQLVADNS